MLKIIARRVPTKNGPRIEIVKIRALGWSDLPDEYLTSGVACWKTAFGDLQILGPDVKYVVTVGNLLTVCDYTALMHVIGLCGQRLYEINTRIRAGNAGWAGLFVSSF